MALTASATPGGQTQFRGATDLILVDVQVVRGDGTPVGTLAIGDFRVSIDRRPRRVVSADFLGRNATGAQPAGQPPPAPLPVGTPGVAEAAAPPGRTFVIAVDLLTFDVGASRGVSQAARQFVEQLAPTDRVGLFPYPLGRRIEASTDHAATLASLDSLVGQRQGVANNRFYLSSADIVDWWAGDFQRIVARECGGGTPVGGGRGGAAPALGGGCAADLGVEVAARTQEYEAQALLSTEMLRGLFESMRDTPGRKFVVLLSGGMPLSDRPGGRPDGADSARDLGVVAARSNVGLYSLYIDGSFLERFSASTRTQNRQPVNLERDSNVSSQWLGLLAAGAGGALMKVLVGSGETTLDRVLRETSAYYLLGVEPAAADRDGRPHAIDVTVNPRGLTVRSRKWVVMK